MQNTSLKACIQGKWENSKILPNYILHLLIVSLTILHTKANLYDFLLVTNVIILFHSPSLPWNCSAPLSWGSPPHFKTSELNTSSSLCFCTVIMHLHYKSVWLILCTVYSFYAQYVAYAILNHQPYLTSAYSEKTTILAAKRFSIIMCNDPAPLCINWTWYTCSKHTVETEVHSAKINMWLTSLSPSTSLPSSIHPVWLIWVCGRGHVSQPSCSHSHGRMKH